LNGKGQIVAGTWSTITNAPPDALSTTLLLTDGSVLAQGFGTNEWYILRPDSNGSYANGTWTQVASSADAPLYYASGVLRDGRVIYTGGEYDGFTMVFLNTTEIYDPVADTWTSVAAPAGWSNIGDCPGCVLPDGRWFVGRVGSANTAIYDPVAGTWAAAANKISNVSEEGWSLLPDGSILSVDCTNEPNAEKYLPSSNQWVPAGATPHVLVDSINEIGAQVLLPDGRVFAIGATGFTALYTPPPIANQVGTWVDGPTIPQVSGQAQGAVDAPACLLPNGNVLFTAGPITSPAGFNPPTSAFEYDPAANAISQVGDSANTARKPYEGRMLMLPTGQVLFTSYTGTVELYGPDGAPDPVWVPTITGCPNTIRQGATFTLQGRQINGLSQCVYYGNDATQATNYPIVRLESTTSSAVYYCKTSNFSTMGLQTGTVVHSCDVKVPGSVPLGSYCLVVVANGIASACKRVTVARRWKWVKELKLEIKEKLEVFENFAEKRVPDIIDIKAIRESGILDLIEEEWERQLRTVAESVDTIADELGRAFIRPDQRPAVGPPEPVIEKFEARRISAVEAERAQTKHVQIRGKEVVVTDEARRLHDQIHGTKMPQKQRPTRTESTVKKSAKKSAVKKKAVKRSPPPRKRT
jgi:hypothetical protein